MPFGHSCEWSDFDACVAGMSGKVDDPESYCGALMRDTEEQCRMADKPKMLSDAGIARAKQIGLDVPGTVVFRQFDAAIDPFEDRKVKFTVTTSTPDRENDVLETGGIDTAAYETNPVVQWAHDYKQLPVGRCVAIERFQNKLIATVEFATSDLNPFAEQVYRMVKAGYLKACSIGFRPLEWDYDETRGGVNFRKSEMMEFSICPIPANAEALVAARAAGIDTAVLKDWACRLLMDFAEDEQDERIELAHEADDDFAIAVGVVPADVEDDVDRVAAARLGYTEPAESVVRWNPRLSKSFDVTTQEFPAAIIEQDLAAKYCGCKVKNLYHRHEAVCSTRMGAFLCALDETIADMQVEDIRNLDHAGEEYPPLYEHIQLNSTKSAEFLVDGLRFLTWNGVKLALRVEPRWYGLQFTCYVERKHADVARAVFTKTFARAKEFNFLKGEAFSLSGEFLTRGTEDFGDIFLSDTNQRSGQRLVNLLNDKGAQLENRGVIMLGPPGNGKTLLGRILMSQAKTTFIWCAARDFWYSGGFRGLADAFEIARECAPSIIFIEDVDNYLDGHTTDLMKSEMDGIAQSKGVVTILTTNYPELLPKALIDRPGRFHDVLRFDLPDADARTKMLQRWLPELIGNALADTVRSLHGYSGAHVREFARFAGIIRDQDGLDIGQAAKSALLKLQEQRDLITSVQSNGSRYRAPDFVGAKAPAHSASDLAVVAKFATEPEGPFARDAVAWKAFVRTRERIAKRLPDSVDREISDDVIANELESYGFDEEAAIVRNRVDCAGMEQKSPDMMEPDGDGNCEPGYAIGEDGMCHMKATEDAVARTGLVTVTREFLDELVGKRGRVLSKTNETKIRNARDANQACTEMLTEVLATVAAGSDEDEDELVAATENDVVVRFIDDESSTDEIVVLAGDDLDAEMVTVDPSALSDIVTNVVGGNLSEVVRREIRRAINEARGRLD